MRPGAQRRGSQGEKKTGWRHREKGTTGKGGRETVRHTEKAGEDDRVEPG